MQRQLINPWTWQDQFGFVQAHAVTGAERTIYCSGQTSMDAGGNPMAARLSEAGCRPAMTLLEVSRLALPPLLVELEATAVVHDTAAL